MSFSNYKNFEIYKGKSILAVDYGTKVTGLAQFCPGREPFPSPFGKIIYKSDEQVVAEIQQIVDDEVIDIIVLGLPTYEDGNQSEMTKRVKAFGLILETNIKNIQLKYQDETYSTYSAKERMMNSPQYNFQVDPKKLDAVAASIILEDFIRQDK